ncbi:MAG: glycosyltransferase [Solirubrobacteraceae bacterium]|nr:glycosyltransferase [Solirubrobacteraceae bacterium]
MSALRVAYITGAYPAVSHTFIDREIQSLRGRGVHVETITLRSVPPEDLLTEHDREEAARTFRVLPPSPARLLAAHLRAFATSPRRYLQTLRLAQQVGRPGLKGAIWKAFYFVEAVLVADHLRRRDVPHIHAHFANSATWVAMLAAEVSGRTWSFTMHGPSEFDDVSLYGLGEKARRAAFVACIGTYCQTQMMRVLDPADWDKLIVVRCGVDLEQYAPAPSSPARPAGASVILSVGRLSPDKGQRNLLRAAAKLRDGGWQGTLRLVGDGPDRPALEALARELGMEDQLELPGSRGQDVLPDLYRDADIFVMTSLAEGIPVVLMEAMATGLPVVTPAINGIAELVEHDLSGLTTRPGRGLETADALARLDEDPELRGRLGRRAREAVAAEFAHPAVVGPLIAAFTAATTGEQNVAAVVGGRSADLELDRS